MIKWITKVGADLYRLKVKTIFTSTIKEACYDSIFHTWRWFHNGARVPLRIALVLDYMRRTNTLDWR